MFLVLGENVIKFSLRLIPRWIASEPLHGWPLKTNQSKVAIEYLLWQQSQISGRIQHVGNYREYTVNTVEFRDWFWNGCRKCYPNRCKLHLRLELCCAADPGETKVTTSSKC